VFIKDCRVLGLRRGDLHHVACWIRSSSSGCVHRVIGRISIQVARCERPGQTQEDHPGVRIIRCVTLYHVVSELRVDHGEVVLIDRI
jgi:hypothetical protein